MKVRNPLGTAILFAVVVAFATSTQAQDISTLTVTENGVGPINKNTPFNLIKVRALLPKFQVKKEVWVGEGDEQFPVLVVSDRNHRLLVIRGRKKIELIEVVSNRVPTSTRVKVGTLFSLIYPTGKPEGCDFYSEDADIGCPAPNSKHIFYLFAEYGDEVGNDGFPPLKYLQKAKLKTIEWGARGND